MADDKSKKTKEEKKDKKKEDKPENLPTPNKDSQYEAMLAKSNEQIKALQESLEKQGKEHTDFKNNLKKLFVTEEEEKKNDPNADLKKYIQEQIQGINERLDKRDHQESLDNIGDSVGLETQEQKDFLEFKLLKAQEAKEGDLTAKEVEKIAKGVKSAFSSESAEEKERNSNASTVTEKDGGPASSLGDASAITMDQFREMNLIDRAELHEKNPKLYSKYIEKERKEDESFPR